MFVLKRNKTACLLGVVILIALLAACNPGAAQPTPSAGDTTAGDTATVAPALEGAATATPAVSDPSGYPPPAVATVDPYPAGGQPTPPPTETPPLEYPPSAVEEAFLEPRFRIDQPVAAGATTITGQAPPNLTLAILDVTYNGAPLGSGRTDESGRFSIPVTGLIAGNRIGLTIGELPEGMDIAQTAEQFFPYRGEGFQNLPNLGVFYDTALVQP